jgi:hypothetical protein
MGMGGFKNESVALGQFVCLTRNDQIDISFQYEPKLLTAMRNQFVGSLAWRNDMDVCLQKVLWSRGYQPLEHNASTPRTPQNSDFWSFVVSIQHDLLGIILRVPKQDSNVRL